MAVVSAAWVLSTVAFEALFANGVLTGVPHELGVFQWISTLGAFLIMVVYGVMALGAFSGLSDHPNKVGLVVSGLLGIAVAVGAIFGAIYKVAAPVRPRLALGGGVGGVGPARHVAGEGP